MEEVKINKKLITNENNQYFLNSCYNDIDYITDKIKIVKDNVRQLVINKDISLDERWYLFCRFATECNKGKYNSVYSFENENFQKYLDSRDFDRDTEVELDQEFNTYIEWNSGEFSEEQLNQDIIEVKEECLENFIYSYYNCY